MLKKPLLSGRQESYAFSAKLLNSIATAIDNRRETLLLTQKLLFAAVLIVISTVQLSAQVTSYTFNNAGASGPTGPSQTQVNNEYASTSLDGKVTVIGSGKQLFIVPSTGYYKIKAVGAGGGGSTNGSNVGGKGASMEGEFFLGQGDSIEILVGQIGQTGCGAGGGGGGTFVVRNGNPILVAGGGGGATSDNNAADASTSTSGTNDFPGGSIAGGINGNGGQTCNVGGAGANHGGGGGGFYGDGAQSTAASPGDPGKAYVNGGEGGSSTATLGGFGGGGGATNCTVGGGGGGGYSGGAGGQQVNYCTSGIGRSGGGGGGSYNTGSNPVNIASVQTGNGSVYIEVLSSGAYNDAGVVSVDSPNVYCAGTHNVVATVQNFGISVIDSVVLNWSVNGVAQTPTKFIGVIDTFGGSGSIARQVTLGSYTFNSTQYSIKVWCSSPNGINDTVPTNDTITVTKQSSLPPPTNVKTNTLSSSTASIVWNAGSLTNSWAYVNSTSNTAPTGPGTIVTVDSVGLTGLQPRTTYYFYVREICPTGDSSVWEGPLTYRTPCVAPLNGTYTIDPALAPSATNFVNFSEAVTALHECTITGPVVFQVAANTYNERLVFNEISGASATNTVTFVGAGIGSTILTNNATGTGDMVTVLFNGADYIGFRDMTVEALDNNDAVAFMFFDEANYNRLENMHLRLSTTTTDVNTAGISFTGDITDAYDAGNSGHYNIMDSLNIEGAYYGIALYGASTGTPTVGNQITNCNFTQQNYYPIYSYYSDKMLIDNCTTSPTRNAAGDGFYIYYASNSVISNNRIDARDYGMYLYYFNANNYDNNIRSVVYNNMVHSSSDYGVYFYYADNIKFYHNSVSATSGYAIRFFNSDNSVVLNNHFKNYRTSASSYVFYTSGSSFDSLDYNNYMSYSSSNQFYFDGAISDFTNFQQSQPLFNIHSYNQEPNYLSNTDLHIDQTMINIRGIGVDVGGIDNDGDARCTFAPTLGADESNYPTPSPSAVIAAPDSVYENSPAAFFSAFKAIDGVALDYTWYLNGVAVDKGRDYKATLATGTYDLALKVRSCSGTDSVASTFNVIAPTSTPKSDFVADKLVVDPVELVTFADLSDYGATMWQWTGTPSSEIIWNNPNSDNPTAFFLTPGEYEICLRTENANGLGVSKCKKAYISVNDEIEFCSIESSKAASGRITDEGGTGVYTNSTSCSFAIQPCADQVFLKFSEFVLADGGDVLKVYDGVDNTGILLGTFSSNSTLPGGNTGLVANSGKMYLEWTTNGSGTAAGFTAHWTSTPDQGTPTPVADFIIPNTVYTGEIVRFESSSTGNLLEYEWDFDPPSNQDGLEGGDLSFDRYSWNAAGTYPVELAVSNCGGTDVITKQVTVVDPTSAPIVGFKADKLKAPVLNTITLTDTSKQGPIAWKWEVTPSFAANIIGADNQKQLKVSFTQSGMYTVKLIVTNSVGTDSVIRTNYIDIFDYCDPVAGNVSSDIGISRVKIRSIDNSSPVGQTRFSSYLNDFAPVDIFRRGTVDITVERNSIIDSMNRNIWIDWNNDGDFSDSGELVASEPAAKTFTFTTTITVPNNAALGFTVMRVGTSYGSNKNTPCGINPTGEYEDYPLSIGIDNVKPMVSLNGPDTVRVEQWYQYTDMGATATDNIDGNLTSSINVTNNVDTTTVGTYYVTYEVTDTDGNKSTSVARVVQITPDVTAPVIDIVGSNPESVTVSTTYNDAGATATDYFNRSLTGINSGDNIDMSKLGSYYVYYTVSDAAGNKDSAVRIVNVVDDIAPVVNLNGGDTVVVEVNTIYSEPGYITTDNYYAGANVLVNRNLVNLAVVGVYPITYTATDSSGNTSVTTRYIDVQDNTLPVIKLIGNDTVTIDVNTDYFEQGAKVTDNYCSNVQWNVDTAPDTETLGDYTLTYSAVDCENNSAITVTRIVRVVDRTAPVLYLKGLPTVSIQRWQPYTDAGVKIVDNYYDSATLGGLLDITSDVDYLTEGVYSICYRVTDPSGNTSNQVCRVVTVGENTTSVNGVDFAANINLYPNPSNGKFSIDFGNAMAEDATLTIVDMTGRTVHEVNVRALTETMSIDLTNLPAGVYMARIQQRQNSAVLRFTIAK